MGKKPIYHSPITVLQTVDKQHRWEILSAFAIVRLRLRQIVPDQTSMTTTIELDACGLQCPLPLLKLKQQLNKLQKGDRVSIQTTDAGSLRDFTAFVSQSGNIMHECREEQGRFLFLIEKGA